MATTTEASNSSGNNADNTTTKIIKIQSNDGEIFNIDQGVVEQSSTIKTLSDCKFKHCFPRYQIISFFYIYLVMDVGDVPIPLPNVKASILGPVRI